MDRPMLRRHTYLEGAPGPWSCLLTLTETPAGRFSVEALRGRSAGDGVRTTAYAGSGLSMAIDVFELGVAAQLAEGYREAALPPDPEDVSGVRHGPYLRERGATPWCWQPELRAPLSLAVLSLAEAQALDARAWRFEGPYLDLERWRTIYVVGPEMSSRRIAISPDGGPMCAASFPDELGETLRDAGLSPIIFETARGRWTKDGPHVELLTDVWLVAGQDCAAMPGAERMLLRDQVGRATTKPTLRRPSKVAEPAVGCRAYSLLDGQRAIIVA